MHGHVVRVVLGVIAEEHRTPGVGGRWLEAKWVLALVSARAAGCRANGVMAVDLTRGKLLYCV